MSFFEFEDHENIQRHLTRLDQVQVEYESRWGVNRLPSLCSDDMQAKWNRQRQKLQDAVNQNLLYGVRDLVDGSIRAYAAMENDALARGNKPHDAEMWDVKHPDSGQVFRIVKSNYDAGIALKDGAMVFTLQEVARILDAHATIKDVKATFPDATVANIHAVDWNKGDDLPF